MRDFRGVLAVFVLLTFTLTTVVALAPGAPPGEKAFTEQAIVSANTSPTVANVPPMTVGFDVIQNLSSALPRLASVNHYSTDTSGQRGQSTTVAERSQLSGSGLTTQLAKRHCVVMLA